MQIPRFRVWIENTMVSPAPVHFNFHDDGEAYVVLNFRGFDHALALNNVEPDVIMQSTGLKDKNGKEIFVDDILNYQWSGAGFNDNYLVRFEGGTSERPQMRAYGAPGVEPLDWAHNTEIIGNIHENPELIKEQS